MCQAPARGCADGPVRRYLAPRARVSIRYKGRESCSAATLRLSKLARGDRDLVVLLRLLARPTQTGAATIVAVHRMFYAPVRSTESRSLTRTRSQSCVSGRHSRRATRPRTSVQIRIATAGCSLTRNGTKRPLPQNCGSSARDLRLQTRNARIRRPGNSQRKQHVDPVLSTVHFRQSGGSWSLR
jgi:hypothetical protein